MKKQEKFISKEEKKKTGKLKRAIAVGATTLAAVGLCLNQTGALAYLTEPMDREKRIRYGISGKQPAGI